MSLNTSPVGELGKGGKIFDSLGAGLMVGFNAWDGDGKPGSAIHTINFGAGALVATDFRTLAPGVTDGQVSALPENQLTRKSSKTGFMFMMSYKILEFNLQ